MRLVARALVWTVVLALSGCGGDDPQPSAPSDAPAQDPGLVHIHGLGVNPADGALFIATHTGLFRSPPGERTATRVGDLYQDTMGFTVVGPNRFLGSGHPDARSDLPPMLGLVESTDAGRTWDTVSLTGEADFHILRAAGNLIYGFDATNSRLLRGPDWTQLPAPPGGLIDLVVHPRDPERLAAATERGIFESRRGGERWRILAPGRNGLLAYDHEARLVLVRGDGRVERSSDGRSWRRAGHVPGQPASFVADGRSLFAAVHAGPVPVFESRDGGATWKPRVEITEDP